MITHTELAQTEAILNRGKEILNDLQELRSLETGQLYSVKVEYNSNNRCETSSTLLKMVVIFGKETLIKKLEEELADIPIKLHDLAGNLVQGRRFPSVISEEEKQTRSERTTHLDGT